MMNNKESPPVAEAAAPVPSRPQRVFAVFGAILLPVFFTFGAGLLFLLLGQGGVRGFFEVAYKGGPFIWVVLGFAFLATAACALLLAFAALGWRVPAAVLLAAASLPWLAGVAGTALGNHRVTELTVQFGIPGPALMAELFSEVVLPRMLGALFGGALLSAVGVGWGAAAIGQMAPGRRVLGAPLGIGSALPLAVIAAVLLVTGDLAPTGAVALLAALAALLAVGLAGAGAGADPPHARSAALAASAPVAAGLSFIAAATFVHSWATARYLEGVARSGPAGIGEWFGSFTAASSLRTAGAVLALLPILTLAAWAWARSRPQPPRIVAAALCVLVALAVIGLDGLAARPSAEKATELEAGPWPASSQPAPAEPTDPAKVDIFEPPSAERPGPPVVGFTNPRRGPPGVQVDPGVAVVAAGPVGGAAPGGGWGPRGR